MFGIAEAAVIAAVACGKLDIVATGKGSSSPRDIEMETISAIAQCNLVMAQFYMVGMVASPHPLIVDQCAEGFAKAITDTALQSVVLNARHLMDSNA